MIDNNYNSFINSHYKVLFFVKGSYVQTNIY